ncbi:MAG: TrkA family potassium uptake protein [Lachnospiraceae bacterium]|nr:TrkA family potassium uptake protein [Lachnospiraceae bacterium]
MDKKKNATKKNVKEIVIFGLGRLGKCLAEEFSAKGGQVVAIDNDQKRVDEIADQVAYAIRADVMDTDTIKGLSIIKSVDAAIIAMGGNFEATIMAIIMCKEMGIENVIAKASNSIQANVLEKIGATRIIFPEEEIGKRIAMSLLFGNIVDIIPLSDKFSMVEVEVPKKWIGKNLIQLDLRKKHGFNVIAIRENNVLSIEFDIEKPLHSGMELVVVGDENRLNSVFKKEK